MTLLGLTESYNNGIMHFANDLTNNIAKGNINTLSILDEADAYIERNGLDFPPEPEAREVDSDPDCVVNPILEVDLHKAGITTILWATGFTFRLQLAECRCTG